MTIREALHNSISFSVSESQAEMISIERGLDIDGSFDINVAKSKGFLLCKADLIRLVVTMPNVSEGGVSISFADKNSMISIANGIYSRFDEPLIQELHPTVEYLDW